MADRSIQPLAENFQMQCPHLLCRKVLAVPVAVRGQVVRCSHCQKLLKVPLASQKKPSSSTAA